MDGRLRMANVTEIREIEASLIRDKIRELFLQANYCISKDILTKMTEARDSESGFARDVMDQILESYKIAEEEDIAICQDTGMSLVFAEIGQDVHINGDFEEAVNQGVSAAYTEGYLRASVVDDPLFDRKNTKNNCPAIIYIKLVKGSEIKLTAVAKGFGSENCSRSCMFAPATPIEGIEQFIVDTITDAGSKACPPIIAGVGIGGTLDKAAVLAKQATARPLGAGNPDPRYAELEKRVLDKVNASGIGPSGLGGVTTAIAVNIEYFPTHIASIPVVVNMCCHASRHAVAVI